MTPEQQLAAITAVVSELDELDDPSEGEAETTTLAAVRDILTGRYPELYARYIASPEPLADTLPPGPIACPNCGMDDSWAEWAYVAQRQPVILTDEDDGTYEWGMTDKTVDEDSRHDYWECTECEHPATPEIAAALTIRANA